MKMGLPQVVYGAAADSESCLHQQSELVSFMVIAPSLTVRLTIVETRWFGRQEWRQRQSSTGSGGYGGWCSCDESCVTSAITPFGAMAAFVKSKLKAARDAINKKDFDTALSAAREVLSFESNNYNACVHGVLLPLNDELVVSGVGDGNWH